MGFFKNMTFPRWVILVMFTASAVLGWFVYERSKRLETVQIELSRTPKLVKEIQELALELDGLQRAADKEGLRGEADLEFYIRSVGSHEAVRIGQVNTTPRTSSPMRGVEDRVLKIQPTNKDARYTRGQIGNFLYRLEEKSRRVKVTRIKLDPWKRIKPGEIGDDNWTFEAEITSRQAAPDA